MVGKNKTIEQPRIVASSLRILPNHQAVWPVAEPLCTWWSQSWVGGWGACGRPCSPSIRFYWGRATRFWPGAHTQTDRQGLGWRGKSINAAWVIINVRRWRRLLPGSWCCRCATGRCGETRRVLWWSRPLWGRLLQCQRLWKACSPSRPETPKPADKEKKTTRMKKRKKKRKKSLMSLHFNWLGEQQQRAACSAPLHGMNIIMSYKQGSLCHLCVLFSCSPSSSQDQATYCGYTLHPLLHSETMFPTTAQSVEQRAVPLSAVHI